MFHSIQPWWDTWDLRLVILFSLFLQTFLILSGPLRKITTNSLVIVPVWLAYNFADVIAILGVGLISKPCGDTLGPFANPQLVAFWAPFLVLHLGGQDTITAFALADNELWMRHLLQLVIQIGTASYVFILTLSNNNRLWLPTLLVFISAFIKSTERTRSLYLASWHKFRDSLLGEPEFVEGPNHEQNSYWAADDETGGFKSWTERIKCGYRLFMAFKGLIADLKFGFRERDKSRSVFVNITPAQAFELIEVELNFLYDFLFTKAMVVRSKCGITLRVVSFASCLAALLLFHSMDAKEEFLHHKVDLRITYTLLFSAIAHDVIALVMLGSSDWNEAKIHIGHACELEICVSLLALVNLLSRIVVFLFTFLFYCVSCSCLCCLDMWDRRWSGCIPQCSLISYCLHPRSKKRAKLIGYLGLTNILDRWKYVSKKRFNDGLRDFIFKEAKLKSSEAEDIETAKEFCSAKGNWVLSREAGCETLLPSLQADDDKIFISWHVATELCYNSETTTAENEEFREICKVLSDYMLYLLIMEPSMMSTVAGIAQKRFRDTCDEAKMFFKEVRETSKKTSLQDINIQQNESPINPLISKQETEMVKACKSILGVYFPVAPQHMDGATSTSVLSDAWMLAKELNKLEGRKWKIMSKVWVELLSYAALHCKADSHAAQLSKGGQLISLVWLLMFHMGLGDKFQVSERHQKLKIVAG